MRAEVVSRLIEVPRPEPVAGGIRYQPMPTNRPEPVPDGGSYAEQDLTAGLSADVGRRSGNGRKPVRGVLYAGPHELPGM